MIEEAQTDRARRTLRNIRSVCLEFLADGRPVYVAAVARELVTKYGGPKEQSIRDQPLRLRLLVELYGREQQAEATASGAQSNGRKGQKASKDESVLDAITDINVRAYVSALMTSLDDAQGELSSLRAAFRRIKVTHLNHTQCYEQIEECADEDVSEGRLSRSPLTEAEIDAIRTFLSDRFLYDENMRVDESLGLVSDRSGRLIIGLPFVSALRKMARQGQ
ncbi:gamma-mobile-trio protein GmtX [Phreatobacter sp.]|uniref:gamma-mobile-trio protein GmtX n=1 Tax=Phreatobacter sp. TaxID=1966341 RepID=UPI0022C308B2|nr:gamma-mobile-trio protein GmtX [Phreatobacter sp.]MCZ8316606.1 gamma-mobile-trio protein GmtX [Phreatobacter sp.]